MKTVIVNGKIKLTGPQKAAREIFVQVTSASGPTALKYLQAAEWNAQAAIDDFHQNNPNRALRKEMAANALQHWEEDSENSSSDQSSEAFARGGGAGGAGGGAGGPFRPGQRGGDATGGGLAGYGAEGPFPYYQLTQKEKEQRENEWREMCLRARLDDPAFLTETGDSLLFEFADGRSGHVTFHPGGYLVDRPMGDGGSVPTRTMWKFLVFKFHTEFSPVERITATWEERTDLCTNPDLPQVITRKEVIFANAKN